MYLTLPSAQDMRAAAYMWLWLLGKSAHAFYFVVSHPHSVVTWVVAPEELFFIWARDTSALFVTWVLLCICVFGSATAPTGVLLSAPRRGQVSGVTLSASVFATEPALVLRIIGFVFRVISILLRY